MGEIADMMLDGTLDCVTGEYIGESVGYPRTIEIKDRGKKKKFVQCPFCGKLVCKQGLAQHKKSKHGDMSNAGC